MEPKGSFTCFLTAYVLYCTSGKAATLGTLMTSPELPVMLLDAFIHAVALFSGWLLIFRRPELLDQTYQRFFNVSIEYVRYAAISLTTFSSALYFALAVVRWLQLPLAEFSLYNNLQSMSTALSFCLVHFYFYRTLSAQRGDHGLARADRKPVSQ